MEHDMSDATMDMHLVHILILQNWVCPVDLAICVIIAWPLSISKDERGVGQGELKYVSRNKYP